MNILVTGGLGFIGSHIVNNLIMGGHTVRVLDNIDSRVKSNKIELLHGDIRNFASCQKACSNIEIVFHNAAIVSLKKSFNKPGETEEINVEGTKNLLKASAAAGVKRFVFSSSGKIYGNTEKLPSKEDDVPNPNSPYALSKYKGEILCRQSSERSGLNVTVLRYFSVYGPGQKLSDGFIGEVLMNIFQKKNVILYADETMSRDFTFIDDVVQANLLCLNYKDPGYDVFNIGSGKRYYLKELLQIIGKITGKDIKPIYKPILEGTVSHTQADISKARRSLKYSPKVYLEEGLKKTLPWIKSLGSFSETES